MKKTLLNALNDQIKHEFESAYAYLAMSNYFEQEAFPGMAHWMRLQYQEETAHALKILDFLHDRDQKVVLGPIAKPSTSFKSPLDVFQKSLKQEKTVTGLIHDLYALAVKEKDYPAQVMLQWFIEEQVEEEKAASDVIDQLKRIGDDGAGLVMLDQQLGQRSNAE